MWCPHGRPGGQGADGLAQLGGARSSSTGGAALIELANVLIVAAPPAGSAQTTMHDVQGCREHNNECHGKNSRFSQMAGSAVVVGWPGVGYAQSRSAGGRPSLPRERAENMGQTVRCMTLPPRAHVPLKPVLEAPAGHVGAARQQVAMSGLGHVGHGGRVSAAHCTVHDADTARRFDMGEVF